MSYRYYPTRNGNSGKFLKINANGQLEWATVAGGGIEDGDKGDITVSGTGATWTIDNLAVTDAKINDVAASKVTESTTKRFVTDTEKSTWNSKQSALSNASASVSGILTSTDWSTFNNKLNNYTLVIVTGKQIF